MKKKKPLNFIQMPKLKKMQFGAVADIYITKKYNKVLIACHVNQWDIYNRLLKCIKMPVITIYVNNISL